MKIHQLLHGYKRGHEQLAASTKLNREDSDVITRLSDLSGTLIADSTFNSYLTCYPLPSGDYYALARTWPDPDAPRPGCVLTKTFLVRCDEWGTLRHFADLRNLTNSKPDRHTSTLSETQIIERDKPEEKPNRAPVTDFEVDFVSRYFGEGTRPLVWFDAPDAEEKLWNILFGLWPAARRRFSSCTLCLQPRNLTDRPFDLMFAPQIAVGRFSRFVDEHIIRASDVPASEEWHLLFAEEIFGGERERFHEEEHLKRILDSDPTSIRKVFLFRDLWNRSFTTPTAAIGAVDLLESVPQSEETNSLRVAAYARAIHLLDTIEEEQKVQLLSMLLARSTKPGISEYLDSVREGTILQHLWGAIKSQLPQVVELVERFFSTGATAVPDFLLDPLAKELERNEQAAIALSHAPFLSKNLLIGQPEVFCGVLGRDTGLVLRSQLTRWLDEPEFQDSLPLIRSRLIIFSVTFRDVPLLQKLLRSLTSSEIDSLLPVLLGSSDTNPEKKIAIDYVASSFPQETRAWFSRSRVTTKEAVDVVASTYSENVAEYAAILGDDLFIGDFRDAVFAAWVLQHSQHKFAFRSRMASIASSTESVLLSLTNDANSLGKKAIGLLVDGMSSVPISSPVLLQRILEYPEPQTFQRLSMLAARTAIVSFIESGKNWDQLEKLLNDQKVIRQICAGYVWDFTTVLRGVIRSTDTNVRAWDVLRLMSQLTIDKDVELVIDATRHLSSIARRYWSSDLVRKWIDILGSCHSQQGYSRSDFIMSGEAVRFAFENTELPVSSLLIGTFLPLHVSVAERKWVPPSASPLFSIWDWDKGKELREAIINAFLRSKWPPGDLALAVGDVHLLRKIFKRMWRHPRGPQLAKDIYSDLAMREDHQSRQMAKSLSNLLANPDFYEDWD